MIISRLLLCSVLVLCTNCSSEMLFNRQYHITPNSKYHGKPSTDSQEAYLSYDDNQPDQNENPYYHFQELFHSSRVKRGIKLSSGPTKTTAGGFRSSNGATRPRSNSLPNLGTVTGTTFSRNIGGISGAGSPSSITNGNSFGSTRPRSNSLPSLGIGGTGAGGGILSNSQPKPFNAGLQTLGTGTFSKLGSGGGTGSIIGNGNSFGSTRPRSNSLPTLGTSGLGLLSSTKPQVNTGLTPFSKPITAIGGTTGSLSILNNGNSFLTSVPRSSSLPNLSIPSLRPPTTGGTFSSQITPVNYGQQNKPSFGMDTSSSSSSSPRLPLNQNSSPLGSQASSRRGSFGLADDMEAWGGINDKTPAQLQKFDKWETRPINNAGLNDNCYYCTASGLSGRDTHRMVQKTETMQQKTGSIADTLPLLRENGYPRASAIEFQNLNQMGNYLKDKVPPGTAQRFGVGYQHNTGGQGVAGHMVGMKVWKTTDGQMGAREVDFQKPPQNRFTQGPAENLNNYNPPGPGPFHLIDLQPFQHSKRRAENQLTRPTEEGGSQRVRFAGE